MTTGSVRTATILSLAVLMLLGASVHAVFAKDAFKDEAGRVIYTIDDDWVVSMFENSPTDLTMSVTRGSREQMQPRITEITPESVTAGTTAVLRLKGKNLIGAAVKLSASTIEVGAYAGKPTALDIPIRIPVNVSPGQVVVEIATPIGQTKTSFAVTEVRIGGAGPVQRDGAAKQAVTTAAPTNCPEGMVGVAAERGGFCIEIDRSFASDYRKAEKACAVSGKRLCQVAEWRAACELASGGKESLKNMVGKWEWTGTQVIKERPGETADYGATGELRSVLMGQSDCKTERDYQTWRTEEISGRCCK